MAETAVTTRPDAGGGLAHLIAELQGHGLRVEVPMESRQGGAGPADAGMLWIDGVAATVPTSADYAQASPYVLRAEDDGWGVYRDGQRLAGAQPFHRPVAARDLDGAVDATLTTGTTATPDKGALYVARCGQAVREAAGLPVEVQFEPPADLTV